jgi:hypothetical protein
VSVQIRYDLLATEIEVVVEKHLVLRGHKFSKDYEFLITDMCVQISELSNKEMLQ